MNNEFKSAIYSRLNTGSLTSLLAGTTSQFPSAIYYGQADEGAPLPYVVFSAQSDTEPNDTRHRVRNNILFVRAYATGSNGAAIAGSIDAQIDTLLHLAPLSVSGWTDLWLARETGVDTVQNEPSGRRVWMEGGMYRQITEKN
jgi:hypothetical protein